MNVNMAKLGLEALAVGTSGLYTIENTACKLKQPSQLNYNFVCFLHRYARSLRFPKKGVSTTSGKWQQHVALLMDTQLPTECVHNPGRL